MSAQPRDVKTVGYVLRRTNYGETDRILDLITPVGKLAVIARGVRKMQSKLAGSVEPFTRSEFNIHQSRKELGVLTGAKMQQFYRHIITDLGRMELASKILQQVNSAAESTSAAEYFQLVEQSLAAIDAGENLELVETWFRINLKQVMGEEINLYRDAAGQKLAATTNYRWNDHEKAFQTAANGEFGTDEIKMLRLMASNDLEIIRKIRYQPQILKPILGLVRTIV